MAYQQRDAERPYHSIDLEQPPLPRNDSEHDERMPLSPRASHVPQAHDFQSSGGSQGPNVSYPPMPDFKQTASSRTFQKMPDTPGGSHNGHPMTHKKANSSWDMLGGIAKDWNGFDSRNASNAAFQYAEGAPQHILLPRTIVIY